MAQWEKTEGLIVTHVLLFLVFGLLAIQSAAQGKWVSALIAAACALVLMVAGILTGRLMPRKR